MEVDRKGLAAGSKARALSSEERADALVDLSRQPAVKKTAKEEKKRYCSAGSHWTTSEFLKIGPVRFICVGCNKRRKAELRNLPGNKLLAAGGSSKR